MKRRIGFLLTHPVQYYAPFFRELARRPEIELQVDYAHQPSAAEQGRGFGVAFQWDVDLTSGYPHRFLENVARKPAQGFGGYDTPQVFREVREGKYDLFVVQGWGWKCMLQAYLACKMSGTPVAVRSDSQLPRGAGPGAPGWKSAVKRLCYPWFIRGYDLCLPFGERSAEYLRHYGGRKVRIVPHVVDSVFFEGQARWHAQRRTEVRESFGIPSGAVCFLFCGKFEDKKRPADLLSALEDLARESSRKAVWALLVGSGALEGELRRVTEERKLPVSFGGFLNQGEIARAYAAADVLVLPSDFRETWGLVVNEAMACGLPVVVSDSCGCCPELVREGETGFPFPVGNIAALAEAMGRMLAEEDRERMGIAARELVAREFTVPVAVERFVRVLGS